MASLMGRGYQPLTLFLYRPQNSEVAVLGTGMRAGFWAEPACQSLLHVDPTVERFGH